MSLCQISLPLVTEAVSDLHKGHVVMLDLRVHTLTTSQLQICLPQYQGNRNQSMSMPIQEMAMSSC